MYYIVPPTHSLSDHNDKTPEFTQVFVIVNNATLGLDDRGRVLPML